MAALCWFLDGPLGDRQWDCFCLTPRPNRLAGAARRLDDLLQTIP